jgi:hypothetical protein
MACFPRCALALTLLLGATGAAQQAVDPPAEPAPGDATYTLHVYANRMQSATLVLNAHLENMRGITADKVTVSLDSGPRFHPTLVRPEGDDPLHLAVLIDASDTDHSFVDAVAAALPRVTGSALHPGDRISLYAMDCVLVRSLDQTPASPDAMRIGLQKVLSYPSLHAPKGHHCGSSLHLWDQMSRVLYRMDDTPGRRVLLVVSQGFDTGSVTVFPKLSIYAGMLSVSVFDLRHDSMTGMNFMQPIVAGRANLVQGREDPMSIITSSNGGVIFSARSWEAQSTLETFVRLLRTRYIVEFPAPDNGEGGFHGLEVQVPKAFEVLPAGVSWNGIDTAVKNDPSTVQAPASPAVLGTRRPLMPR